MLLLFFRAFLIPATMKRCLVIFLIMRYLHVLRLENECRTLSLSLSVFLSLLLWLLARGGTDLQMACTTHDSLILLALSPFLF